MHLGHAARERAVDALVALDHVLGEEAAVPELGDLEGQRAHAGLEPLLPVPVAAVAGLAAQLLTVVMLDQSEKIADSIAAYEGALRAKGLPDIPLHASTLMNGKDQYAGLDLRARKMLLGSFRVFFRHMPVRYRTFAYATKEFSSLEKLAGTMRRDLVNFLFGNLAELQSYDAVKVYYDNDQRSIAELLHRAIEYALSKEVVVY